MRALVTGATGFIGSHLVEHLLRQGYEVRCLVRKTSSTVWLKELPVEYVYGDLFSSAALQRAVAGVDYVFHSAGVTKARHKHEYYRGNQDGTRNLLEATFRQSPQLKRFLHISSQAAVGPSPTRQPIDETTPPHPITTYGRSKLKAEQECLAFASRLPITIARPPVVYGPRDRDVFEFFNTMSKGLQPMIGWKEKYVSMIHVADLVRGFVLAAESTNTVGRIYFITGRRMVGWREIGETTRRAMARATLRVRIPEALVYVVAAVAELGALFSSKPALINFEKAREMIQDFWTCDGSRAARDFGFREEIGLEQGIRETVRWYREQGWLR